MASAEEGAALLSEGNPEEAPPSKTAAAEGGKKKRVPESEATFRVFAELMRPLQQQLEAGESDAEVLLGSVRGCRLLLAAANEVSLRFSDSSHSKSWFVHQDFDL